MSNTLTFNNTHHNRSFTDGDHHDRSLLTDGELPSIIFFKPKEHFFQRHGEPLVCPCGAQAPEVWLNCMHVYCVECATDYMHVGHTCTVCDDTVVWRKYVPVQISTML